MTVPEGFKKKKKKRHKKCFYGINIDGTTIRGMHGDRTTIRRSSQRTWGNYFQLFPFYAKYFFVFLFDN